MERDGNGWVRCSLGHRHWGLFGAAGLLLVSLDPEGWRIVLMQHRADWTHNGGTWGIPGGARDSHETPTQAAFREAREEASLDTTHVTVVDTARDDHGQWEYDTVLAVTPTPLPTDPNDESHDVQWVQIERVAQLPLHPGFSRTWPHLHDLVRSLPASQFGSSGDA